MVIYKHFPFVLILHPILLSREIILVWDCLIINTSLLLRNLLGWLVWSKHFAGVIFRWSSKTIADLLWYNSQYGYQGEYWHLIGWILKHILHVNYPIQLKLWRYHSPQNENLNLLIRSKLLNLFLYSSKQIKNWKIYWSEQSFTGLGPEDRCSLWGLVTSLNVPCMDLYKDDKFVFSNYKLGSKLLHMNNVYWMTLFIVCFLADTLVHRLTVNSVGKMLWWLSLKTLSLLKGNMTMLFLALVLYKVFFSRVFRIEDHIGNVGGKCLF